MLNAAVRETLHSRIRAARARTDELFKLIRPEALYERPIAERHRIIFYLGHLEAFDWNMICSSLFEMKSFNRTFDKLFEFGIDPTNGNLPSDQPGDWPAESEVQEYNRRVREAVDDSLGRATAEQRFWVAIEHRLMHAETLAYMFHRLPLSMMHYWSVARTTDARPVAHRSIEIPAGVATLGMQRNSGSFGWDNEFDLHKVDVPAFRIDACKVTNADFLEFVRAGGYAERSLWSASAWQWIEQTGLQFPRFWIRHNGGFRCRALFAEIPFEPFWPVYVSHSEAQAYARWRGFSLPSEAQFHRAAFGHPHGPDRLYPWGNETPQRRHGNFDFSQWDPARVDAYPGGDSAFGVSGLVGNGWEWTATPFAPFEGFQPFEFYPGYSANFFDGNHYVMKGGSARTAGLLLRRSFRNFFQPLYPHTYSGFRCVDAGA